MGRGAARRAQPAGLPDPRCLGSAAAVDGAPGTPARLAPQPLAAADVPVVGAPHARGARHSLFRAEPPRGCRQRLIRMSNVLLVTNIFPPDIGGPAPFLDPPAPPRAARRHRLTAVGSSPGRP